MYPSATWKERFADGIVHIIGLILAAATCAALLIWSADNHGPALFWACVVYAVSIIISCGISAAYHQLPKHEWRFWMRKVDHAAIYLVIAGTMSPLLVLVGTSSALWILAAIWIFATIGVAFKLFGNNMDSRWSLASYLGLGWFGLLAMPDFYAALPTGALIAIGGGAVLYTVGALFYRNKQLRYRYAIWHAVGLCGAMSFFAANWISLF